jgi:uncharacterized protein (DUF1778 family)
MTVIQQTKQERLEQRVTSAQRALIERGAQATGKSMSEFVIESSCLAAEMAILDQRVTYLDSETFDRFLALLDEPPKYNEGIERLFAKKAPWLA